MKALTWAIRLFILFFFLAFAVQNTDPVVLHLFLGEVWQAPLVIVLLAFLAAGAVLGVTSVLGILFRQRREISRLNRQLAKPAPPEPQVPAP